MNCKKCKSQDVASSRFTEFTLGQKEKVVWRTKYECNSCKTEWEAL